MRPDSTAAWNLRFRPRVTQVSFVDAELTRILAAEPCRFAVIFFCDGPGTDLIIPGSSFQGTQALQVPTGGSFVSFNARDFPSLPSSEWYVVGTLQSVLSIIEILEIEE